MAVYDQLLEQLEQQSAASVLVDALYCEEVEKWDDEEEEDDDVQGGGGENSVVVGESNNNNDSSSFSPLLLLEQDLFWEDEELHSLFSKEKQQKQSQKLNLEYSTSFSSSTTQLTSALCLARKVSVEWMLKASAKFGFSILTSILSINYLDRFLSNVDDSRVKDVTNKPWMIELGAVACLSLAAKVEETHVPLLVQLQQGSDTKYPFDAKSIQQMELVVLSNLGWRMNPVTPISFLDHITRRLGLKTHLHWEFFRRCERLLLSVVADSRFVNYLPSVLATATMMHVIDQIETSNSLFDYQNQLLAVLDTSKDKVMDCYKQILEISSTTSSNSNSNNDTTTSNKKRKFDEVKDATNTGSGAPLVPCSPSGVMDACFSSDSSNDSWLSTSSAPAPQPPSAPAPATTSSCTTMSSSKKSRVHEQNMALPSRKNRVFADLVGRSPR